MNTYENARKRIQTLIETKVFVRASEEAIANPDTGVARTDGWLFDFRRVVMHPESLADVATLFWERYEGRYPVQVGGIETAAIPLVVGIAQAGYARGHTDMTSFFVRKGRKKEGLMRAVEGTLMPGRPIILVDDLINTGKSFIRQIEVLESMGYKVAEVWTILRFRDVSFYTYFTARGIPVVSEFTLDDFTNSLNLRNLIESEGPARAHPYRGIWKFQSDGANYFYVTPKSAPVFDEHHVYMGSDSGIFWAITRADGSPAWSYKVGFHARGKSIFSTPALFKDTVIFGSYDGNVYALERSTGKKRWVFFDADWIGSSPAVAEDLGIVFIGLEFGLFKKRGGIAALDAHTGKKLWWHQTSSYTHASPLYIRHTKEVAIGSNDGIVRLYDARTGALKWEYATGPVSEEELLSGFSARDIKESVAYDETRDILIAGCMDGTLIAIHRKTGREYFRFKAAFGIWGTPLVYGDSVIVSSLDKHVYCIDLATGAKRWQSLLGARIFAAPVRVGASIYVGCNSGRLSELDPATGREKSYMTFPERITNRIAYDPYTARFYVPTFANELYCIEYVPA